MNAYGLGACPYCGEQPKPDGRSVLVNHRKECLALWLRDMAAGQLAEVQRCIAADMAPTAGRAGRVLWRYGRKLHALRGAS